MIPGRVLDLGLRPYDEVWAEQLALVAARQRGEIPDTLVLVEHPEVLTLGRSAKRENLLPAAASIPTFEVERGGDVTYHGPGQLVAYPILLLGDGERDLHKYLRNVEEMVLRTCATFGVEAGRQPSLTGAWTTATPPRKLASIGIAVKRWVTMHGVALNVSTDLARFQLINPCGLDAAVMTSLAACTGRAITVADVKPVLALHASAVFGRAFQPARN